jgi:outer membrane protein assembly factor BamB
MTLVTGKIYVPTHTQGMGVVDARTGATIAPALPAINGGDTYTYDGVVHNGVIYYVSEANSVPRGAKLFAVNLTTRATVWSKDILGNGYLGNNPIVSSTGTLYISAGDTNLLALNAATGSTVASMPGFNATNREPAIGQDGSVYSNQRLPANSIDGTVKYNSSLSTLAWKSTPQLKQPSVGADGTVYGTGFDTDGSGNTAVFALRGSDGAVKWKTPLLLGVDAAPPGWGQVPGATCVAKNGWIYVSSIDQQIYAIR